MKHVCLLIPALALVAFAADVTGTWKGIAETSIGPIERTFVFKVDGNRVTGEASSPGFEKSVLTDGRLEGDRLSFSLTVKVQDEEIKTNVTGQVSGGEIRLHVETSTGAAFDYVIKKVS
jgi:hypothetical protein